MTESVHSIVSILKAFIPNMVKQKYDRTKCRSDRRAMKSMLDVIKGLIKILAAGIISLVILSAFCFVYDYSGVHISNPSGSTDYKWEPNCDA